MKNAKEVTAIINAEIGENWNLSNAHGVDLHICILPPEKKAFTDFTSGKVCELWLVLEEDPKGREGYKIVFDDTKGLFGLATTQIDGPDLFLGLYGSFLETLESM